MPLPPGLPMARPPMGAPPGVGGMGGGPPGGTGAATMPSPMGGSAAAAMSSLKIGLEALQKALPSLPMGSEVHTAVLKAVESVSKHMNENMTGGSAAAIQQLVAMAREAQTNPQRQAMMRMMPGGGGAPGGLPTAPPPPPGGGGLPTAVAA